MGRWCDGRLSEDRWSSAERWCGGDHRCAGFLIYVADASGYLGSVVLLLVRNFAAVDLPWLPFFVGAAYVTSLAGAALVAAAALVLLRKRSDAPNHPIVQAAG
ncbi:MULTISPECIES: DUF5690 family protein [unclassified Phenylobacterium]|uniref:DUF5690 family protein n=1 Tax=unclassified Phenylobacterium TaxID=2640670 RepID=UPI0022B4FB2A|nr:DUF5690 family protein [Phenylobacterium sp. NIBR 498073]WGU42067.1 DUF5690 family protein [Phenylobacterium sp. NIBR 498073]